METKIGELIGLILKIDINAYPTQISSQKQMALSRAMDLKLDILNLVKPKKSEEPEMPNIPVPESQIA